MDLHAGQGAQAGRRAATFEGEGQQQARPADARQGEQGKARQEGRGYRGGRDPNGGEGERKGASPTVHTIFGVVLQWLRNRYQFVLLLSW